MHPRHFKLLVLPLVLTTLAAQAQVTESPSNRPATSTTRQIIIGGPGIESIRFISGEPGDARIVKGAPYCAEAVHETVQTLPDAQGGIASRITRSTSTQLCRDGEGRTRQEFVGGGRKTVYLRDPVAGDNWVLDPDRKTARRMGSASSVVNLSSQDSPALREYAERMRVWARELSERVKGGGTGVAGMPTPPAPPTPPVAPVPHTAPMPAAIVTGLGDLGRLQVIRIGDGAPGLAGLPGLPADLAVPPAVMLRAQDLAPRGAGVQTSLGSKDIEGLRANGERTTWTIEAGKVGNDKPIVSVREVWTSPELMLTLSSRDFDPRSGESTYRLKSLKRGEPDAALMRVPDDHSKSGLPTAKPPAPGG
jgi:hypothetical protein